MPLSCLYEQSYTRALIIVKFLKLGDKFEYSLTGEIQEINEVPVLKKGITIDYRNEYITARHRSDGQNRSDTWIKEADAK
jgi:hypothetical protein